MSPILLTASYVIFAVCGMVIGAAIQASSPSNLLNMRPGPHCFTSSIGDKEFKRCLEVRELP